MSFNPFNVKPMPMNKCFENWNKLYPKAYDKNEVDPYTKVRVILMNGTEFDPRDATWVPRNTLGEYSLFIGDSYPIVKRMPPSMHDTEGLPFMKHGCVFSAHRRMNDMLGHAIPDLCRFSYDESPSC